MTNEEIGKVLGMHPKAVDSVYRKAKVKIIKKLKQKYGDTITLDDILPALNGRGVNDVQMLQL